MQLVHDGIGWIHLLSSVLALIFGTVVLIGEKGSKNHKIIGYFYLINMLILLLSAMFIYRLFGGFGVFHAIALIGFIYLALGILPALFRTKNWLKIHIYCMYWSVIGLYAAFAAEIMVRIPKAPFWWAVGLATALIATGGGIWYGKYVKTWQAVLASKTHIGEA